MLSLSQLKIYVLCQAQIRRFSAKILLPILRWSVSLKSMHRGLHCAAFKSHYLPHTLLCLTLFHIVSHCLTFPHIAWLCLTLPHIASHCHTLLCLCFTLPHTLLWLCLTLPHIASHCFSLPHIAWLCPTLLGFALHCLTLQLLFFSDQRKWVCKSFLF